MADPFNYGEMRDKLIPQIDKPILGTDPKSRGIDPTSVTQVNDFYYNIVSWFLLALGVVAVLVLVYAGIQYITAAGDAEKAEKAKKTIMGAVIGLIIIIASYAIYNYTIAAITPGVT